MLNVFFMNPNVLKEWANGTTIGTIMAWASSWNSPIYKHIPRFEETNDVKTADIRVMFSGVHAISTVITSLFILIFRISS